VEAVDPACTWEAGEVVGVYDSRLSLDGCEIPVGVTLRLYVVEVDPVVVRVRLEEHSACERAPDERERMRALRRQATRQAHERWGEGFVVEHDYGACADVRRIEAIVVETR